MRSILAVIVSVSVILNGPAALSGREILTSEAFNDALVCQPAILGYLAGYTTPFKIMDHMIRHGIVLCDEMTQGPSKGQKKKEKRPAHSFGAIIAQFPHLFKSVEQNAGFGGAFATFTSCVSVNAGYFSSTRPPGPPGVAFCLILLAYLVLLSRSNLPREMTAYRHAFAKTRPVSKAGFFIGEVYGF